MAFEHWLQLRDLERYIQALLPVPAPFLGDGQTPAGGGGGAFRAAL